MINKIKKQAFLFQNEVFCINHHYFSISQTMSAYTTILNTPIHANDCKHTTKQPSSSRYFVVFIPQNLTLQKAIK